MRAPVRAAVAFLVTAAAAPFLPIYVERTMIRSFRESGGDTVEYGWQLHSLLGYLEALPYMAEEQAPVAFLIVNLAVWIGIAAGCGAIVWIRSRAGGSSVTL